MAYTYTLTMDVGSGPWENAECIGFANANCAESCFSWDEVITTIGNLAIQVGNDLTNEYNGTYSFVITNNTITWTFNFDSDPSQLVCGELVYLFLSEATDARAAFIPVEVELCPTCQEVTIDNCGSIIFQAAIPNGTYEVQIEDHQSGITYMQDIEFTGSQGTWDQTNTAGVFTPFSTYTVTIFDESGDPVSWVDGTNEYTCMRLTFATFTDTTPAA